MKKGQWAFQSQRLDDNNRPGSTFQSSMVDLEDPYKSCAMETGIPAGLECTPRPVVVYGQATESTMFRTHGYNTLGSSRPSHKWCMVGPGPLPLSGLKHRLALPSGPHLVRSAAAARGLWIALAGYLLISSHQSQALLPDLNRTG